MRWKIKKTLIDMTEKQKQKNIHSWKVLDHCCVSVLNYRHAAITKYRLTLHYSYISIQLHKAGEPGHSGIDV